MVIFYYIKIKKVMTSIRRTQFDLVTHQNRNCKFAAGRDRSNNFTTLEDCAIDSVT